MQLKNDRVTLRPITVKDAPRFVKWLADPDVAKPLRGSDKHVTLKKELQWIKGLKKKQKTEKQFAIDTAEGAHIGSTGLKIHEGGKIATFGILIGDKQYWGKGYGHAATELLIDYAFHELKLHKIELGVFAFNVRGIRLYKKIGFKTEGVRKEHLFYKGKYYGEILMGLFANRKGRNALRKQ